MIQFFQWTKKVRIGPSTRTLISGSILFFLYLVIMRLSDLYVPSPATLFPASALAMSILFFEGVSLWPFIYLASLCGNILAGSETTYLIIIPLAQSLQAIVGAQLLRVWRIDPLFRRSRDFLFLLITILVSSLIVPTLGVLAEKLQYAYTGVGHSPATWEQWYIATVFCLIILVPFILRWFAKPKFNRNFFEIIELVGVFGALILIDYFIFVRGNTTFEGFSLIYFLIIPLFWIALRLRPRFLTLSLVITSLFAIARLYLYKPGSIAFTTELFSYETFLIVLSTIFFIVVSLEEDRRLSSNLIQSQVAMLQNAISRVSSESQAKNDFIAVLAHELRNPLAPIVSAIDLLRLKENTSEEDTEVYDMMEDRMQTVKRILDDLLDISRITEGKVQITKKPTPLEPVLRRAIISTSHYLHERHQQLTFKHEKSPLIVDGDDVRLEQIFSNLLTNASKYSDSGTPITLTLKKIGTLAEVSVHDEGLGIEPKELENIFEPFHQIDNGARSKKGLGIGLTIVKGFVEMHNGKITVASDGRGKGSTFTVTIPLLQETALPKNAESPTPRVVAPREILVCNDDHIEASAIGNYLKMNGFTVTYAYNTSQVLNAISQRSIDAILIDLEARKMDGYRLARSLREHSFEKPVIAIHTGMLRGMQTVIKDNGFKVFMQKPLEIDTLRDIISGS